ncbi:unnamed protein product, partial [Laminaria digitata]
FLGNSAFYGGGVFLSVSELEAHNATFVGNTATDYGGAILAGNSSVTIADGARFVNNSATEGGGAVMVYDNCFLLLSDLFFGNQAGQSGGAVVAFSAGTRDGYATVSHCVFEHNEAGDAGGALFIGGGFVLINGSRFRSN